VLLSRPARLLFGGAMDLVRCEWFDEAVRS
jgi:hypothetical protein